MLDTVYLGAAALLWALMVLLVRGLQRLQPTRGERA